MEKLTHKNHLKALCLIILALVMINLIGISLVSAGDWFAFDNYKSFDSEVGNYGKVSIMDKGFLWLKDNILQTVELKENSDYCSEDCYADKEIIMYDDGELIDEVRFDIIKGSSDVDYKIMYEVNNQWVEYNYEEVRGSYDGIKYNVRLEGSIKPFQIVDWQIKVNGFWIDEWAIWTSDLNIGLEAYYNFEEGSGTSLGDVSGGNNNGTLFHMSNDNWINGIIGGGLYFNGDDNAVNITINSGFWDYDKQTWSVWIKPNETCGEGLGETVFVTGATGAGDYWKKYQFGRENSCANGMLVNEGAEHVFWLTDNGEAWVKDQWINVVITIDSSGDNKIYFNGVLNNTDTQSWTKANYSDFLIGGGQIDRFYNGTIDELGIWNRTLTSIQILQLYNAGVGITFDPDAPVTSNVVTLNEPLNDSVTSKSVINLTATYEFLNFVVDNATYHIWDSDLDIFNKSTFDIDTNFNVTNISFSGFTPDNYIWNVYACGNNATKTLCNFAESNFTFNVGIDVIAQNFSQTTTEGNSETFKVNITTTDSFQLSQAVLIYNNTNFIGSFTNPQTNNYSIIRTITVPSITTATNFNFFWSFKLENGAVINSSTNTQAASEFLIDDCSDHSTMILNLTLRDEGNQTKLDGTEFNTSIEIDINIFPLSSTTPILEFSNNSLKINPTSVCINDDLNDSIYTMDATIRYSSSDRETEYYHIQSFSLTNSTIPQDISLYDLLSSNAQNFRLRVRDTSFLPINEALIQIERQNIADGTFFITEIPKTDEGGISSASLQTNDVIYNFKIFDQGRLVFTFNNVLAICQTPLVSTCEIDFNAFQSRITIPDYEEGDDFNFTLGYDDSSKIISSQFVIPSGNPSTIKLVVIREDSLGTSVCTDTLTSSSGTLSCVIPSSFGNSTVLAKLFKDDVEQGKGNIKTDQKSRDIFPGILILLSVLVMITLVGMGVSDNPIVTAIFLFVGVVILFGINLIQNTGFVGATATILFFLIAIILIIIKAARRS